MNFIARLMPREGHFFILFDNHAKLIVEGAIALADLLRHYDTVKDGVVVTQQVGQGDRAFDDQFRVIVEEDEEMPFAGHQTRNEVH